ncbi:beta-N-acetylhexosaminidase [Luteolibacter sp. LG18]|uniref:beta-N-acetylhexosaminidase n=1 Tax=Luteolibacter sp. LG18 TaxID=2819286 RepID=UPI002B286AC7|nr:beta-N-acetylhexosaminidase [Luteolibacter sp. LG18]
MNRLLCPLLLSLLSPLSAAEPAWSYPVPPAQLAQAKSALIPFPQEVRWGQGDWKPAASTEIVFPAKQQADLAPALRELAAIFAGKGLETAGVPAEGPLPAKPGRINLAIQPGVVTQAEGYTLAVAADGVTLRGTDASGAYHAVQTLRQLLRGEKGSVLVQQTSIRDWPAFGLRGFMHDTGRNFQTVESLKQQIDRFAAYKLNVFHWHLTDNPAWRIECQAYPQLNDPKFQTRDHGQIYSYAQIRDVIAYAKARHITVIPELDMPGHSAFFDRAFGFSMGSDQGMEVLEKLIAEFCREIPTADCPYLHIGSDEVKIKDPQQFMTRMLKAVRDGGRKPLVWSPGLKADDQTIRQLWGDEGVNHSDKGSAPFVDSAGGYLNGYDPLITVQRYFFRQPARRVLGDDKALGGILCCWPDIRVADKVNIFKHNPVWPGTLAFAECFWHGRPADAKALYSVQPAAETPEGKAYREFENRLAAHRDAYFAGQPFPFVKTSQLSWQVLGPIPRGKDEPGDNAFEPETKIQPSYTIGTASYAWKPATGGTIMLSDRGKEGVLPRSGISTAYALTYVHVKQARTLDAWIGFETPNRSNRQCGGIPAAGKWDAFGAQVWVNDQPLPAPAWKNPGAHKHLSPTWFAPANEEPLEDEEFYWTREPSKVELKAGWNKVLLRVPFGYGAQNWSYTFIPVKQSGGRWIEDESVKVSADQK